MTSENGSGARPKDRSLSSGRSLRNLPTKDYKKFSEGDFCFSEDEKDTIDSGSDADFKKVPPGTSEAELLHHQQGEQPDLTNMADREEIQKLKLELASLSQEEERLQKRREADDLRREVAEKRKSVISLRGKLDISRSKDKSSIKQSKSKEERHKDDDEVNIMTLRHSKSLRRKVNREMRQLGLLNSDELDQSSQESLSSGCVSKDAETLSEGATDCKKKKKKAILLSSEPSDSTSQFSCSSSVSDDYRERKKKSNKKNIKSRKVSGGSAYSKKKSKNRKKILSNTESDTDSRYSFSSSDSDDSNESKKKKKSKRKIKSGIKARASDSVRKSQRYPQAQLRFEFVSANVTFDKLDLNLFVAGELEIITDVRTKNKERNGRLDLLKKIMYLSTSYDFSTLKSYYAAVLREIELGKKSWSDDFQYIEAAILSKHTPKSKSSFQPKRSFAAKYQKKNKNETNDTEEKLWFCSQYQRNKCHSKGSHILVIKGQARHAQHICASCWQKDSKKLEHPECSSACPHYSQ